MRAFIVVILLIIVAIASLLRAQMRVLRRAKLDIGVMTLPHVVLSRSAS
jgi:hypothetical protein